MDSYLLSEVKLDFPILTDTEIELDQKNNWRKSDVDFDTLAIQETMDPGTFTQTCFMPPIVTSSVFNTTIESRIVTPTTAAYVYGRYLNPTRAHLESVLAKFEGGNYAVTFSSGMAAMAAILQACSSGDHIIYVQAVSGDTDWLMKNKLPSLGMTCDDIFSRDTAKIVSKINSKTKLIMLECPSNPILEMADIEEISKVAKRIKPDILIAVDNTILTPIFQRPLELGADVVMYSLTKYFAGYSDVTMGSLVCNSKELFQAYQNVQIFCGAVPSPIDCYLMIRSLKTFPLRMRQHFKSAMKIAHFLEHHPCIDKVFYPGLKSHDQHALALKQQSGNSGLISFYIKGGLDESVQFIKALKYFRHGDSFASDVSIVVIPSITSQRQMSTKNQLELGIEENLLRISVGLEGVERLILDLDQALRKAINLDTEGVPKGAGK